MAVTLKIPTGLTFSDIRSGLPPQSLPAINAYLTSVGAPTVEEGDDNPLVLRLNDFDMGGASFHRGPTMDSLASCGPIQNFQHIPAHYITLIVGVGGDLIGMPVYFVINDIDTEVPANWPNRTWIDNTDIENPVEIVHTWASWYDGMPGHDPYEADDGKFWCSSANTWNRGQPLDASVWAFSGLVVKSVSEFVALRDAENPAPQV